MEPKFIPMTAIQLLSKNKYLKIPLFYSGTGGGSDWRQHLQPCEWIKSDGTAAILLNYIANTNTEIYCKSTNYGTKKNVGMFGSRIAYLNKQFCFVINNQDKYVALVNNESEQMNYTKSDNLYLIYKASGIATINNVNRKCPTYSDINDLRYCVFSLNEDGNILNAWDGNYTEFYIVENEEKVVNLINCYVIDGKTYPNDRGEEMSPGTVGMYDTINNVFYTNAKESGQFTHGNDIEI